MKAPPPVGTFMCRFGATPRPTLLAGLIYTLLQRYRSAKTGDVRSYILDLEMAFSFGGTRSGVGLMKLSLSFQKL
jgi:hypothetical protein